MLNELVIVERGAREARLNTVPRHPDVKNARRMPTLLVQLDDKGQVVFIRPIPHQVTPWTLRDGQHNSFPFIQPKRPLWYIKQNPENDRKRASALERKNPDRRRELLDLADTATFDAKAFDGWPGTGLLSRLRERRQQLMKLDGTESDVVLATFDHFIAACEPYKGSGLQRLLHQVAEKVVEELKRSSQDELWEIAVSLLIGSFDTKKQEWKCSGALLFEASGKSLSIINPKLISSVSGALMGHNPDLGDIDNQRIGICALTGMEGQLLRGNSPQPNLPALGQTYLFAKNKDIPANDRYGLFSVDAMPVGQETIIRLAAAFEALTSGERENITWRKIPGEAPKQSDLLLAFVEAIPDPSVVGLLAEEDFSEEAAEAPEASSSTHDTVAAFEKRTDRMIELVKARVGSDVTKTPVRLAVFRKVDPANRKVVYANTFSVADLYQAARVWVEGERNVPPWLLLPILKKGERKPLMISPPHVAPLGLIAFSKQLFIRGGTERQEVPGLPAAEALGLFLDRIKTVGLRANRVLRIVLMRRAELVSGVAHFQHMPRCWRRRTEVMKEFDRNEALRTITYTGVLLYKFGRKKEVYMNDTAFKLGQLLAAADVVHAGYCADVRGGDVPPSLLGNQVFAMAQTAPTKALATLCRRWKPYDGWAKKAARKPNRVESLIASNNKDDQQRGWDIKKALRYAREVGPIASELAASLGGCRVDDVFRAELLLGYISALPKAQKQNNDVQDQNQGQED